MTKFTLSGSPHLEAQSGDKWCFEVRAEGIGTVQMSVRFFVDAYSRKEATEIVHRDGWMNPVITLVDSACNAAIRCEWDEPVSVWS